MNLLLMPTKMEDHMLKVKDCDNEEKARIVDGLFHF